MRVSEEHRIDRPKVSSEFGDLRSARWLGEEAGHYAVIACVVQGAFAPEAVVPNLRSSCAGKYLGVGVGPA